MRVLGVDPGSAVTGYGVVEADGIRLSRVISGIIRTETRDSRALRLRAIYQRLSRLLEEHAPDAVSLERSFVAQNVQSAFRLGEARAMVLLAAAQHELPLFEYAPGQVKLMVAAYGRADKAQVKFMVRRTLGLDDGLELADDAADALALALCHLSMARMGVAPERRGGRRGRRPAAQTP